jgi:hypothetical protein
MPEISRFFGIVIRMYFLDHPPPHFHARYGGDKARIAIGSLDLLDSSLPPRVLAMVIEWAKLHQAEPLTDWGRLQAGKPPQHIAPLE